MWIECSNSEFKTIREKFCQYREITISKSTFRNYKFKDGVDFYFVKRLKTDHCDDYTLREYLVRDETNTYRFIFHQSTFPCVDEVSSIYKLV